MPVSEITNHQHNQLSATHQQLLGPHCSLGTLSHQAFTVAGLAVITFNVLQWQFQQILLFTSIHGSLNVIMWLCPT